MLGAFYGGGMFKGHMIEIHKTYALSFIESDWCEIQERQKEHSLSASWGEGSTARYLSFTPACGLPRGIS